MLKYGDEKSKLGTHGKFRGIYAVSFVRTVLALVIASTKELSRTAVRSTLTTRSTGSGG